MILITWLLCSALFAPACRAESSDTIRTWQQHYQEAQRCERLSLVGRALGHYEEALKQHPSDTIRRDISRDDNKGLEMFVSGDQLLRGAALNAVEIAEHLIKRNLV